VTRRLLAVLFGLLLALVGLASPAEAADHTVTLATSGPSPSAVTISVGDTVTFKAGDANTYHLRRSSGSWTFTATVTRAKPYTTASFPKAGTYGYTMTFDTLIGPSPPQGGSIVVPAPPPTPTPTAVATTKPSSRPTTKPVGTTPSPAAAPSSTGVAVPPPITGAIIPTPVLTPSLGPAPQVATAGPTQTPSSSPLPHIDYGNPSGIAQKSPHGMGLPTALAVVAAVGVATLIVRILLAAPEAQPEARAGVR
jgi:plastocyanin